MKPRKFDSKKRYLISFIIGTLVFSLIFLISYSLSYVELQRISNVQIDVGYEIFQDKLEYSLFNKSICNESYFDQISTDLGFQGRIIDDLERKLGKRDKNVILMKKFYTLIELEHFEFVNQFNAQCKAEINTILFFYSNNESQIKESEEAGLILGTLGSKEANLTIYSFDVDLKSVLVDGLEAKYQVTKTPAVIVNGQAKIFSFKNIDEIERYLN